jgi:hypothetical protein
MSDNRVAIIEGRIDQERAALIKMDDRVGGVSFQDVAQMMEFAKIMSISDKAVPAFMRGNVGLCLSIIEQADGWGFRPYSLARMAFVVNDQVAYMSQVIHAVIEKWAPLKQRLRAEYLGEGPERQCKIIGHIKGEVDPLEYLSPKLKDISPKNSPLWKTDPDQQLFYSASRAWAKRYCPDILMGAFSKDELEDSPLHIGADRAKDVTPKANIVGRLNADAVARAGFNAEAIQETLEQTAAPAQDAGSAPPSTAAAPPAVAEEPPLGPSPPVSSAAAEPSPPADPAQSLPEADRTEMPETKEAMPASPPAVMPPPPKLGQNYVAYVRLMLPHMRSVDELQKWWMSAEQKKVRNKLPNFGQEQFKESVAIITERCNELAAKEL